MIQEQRSVYLEERCTLHGCGGKIYRVLAGGMIAPGSAAEEAYPVSQAFDRCDTCLAKIRETEVVFSPVWYPAIEVFNHWEAHTIDRPAFDRLISELFSKTGTGWKAQVS